MPTRIGSATNARSAGAVSSLTISVAVGAGTNRALVVGVVGFSSGAAATTRTMTWNGASLTLVGTAPNAGSNYAFAEIWYLPEASLSTTTANLVITPSSGTQTLEGGAQLFGGVDQVTPWGTFASASGATGPTVTVTTAVGDEAIDSMVYFSGGATTGTPSGTLIWFDDTGSAQTSGGQQSTTASGASTTLSWTMGGAALSLWGQGGAALKGALDTLMGQACL